jgi:hypothetical protein
MPTSFLTASKRTVLIALASSTNAWLPGADSIIVVTAVSAKYENVGSTRLQGKALTR